MAVQTEPIHWETSFAQTRERAVQAGKPVLLDFSAAPE